MKNVMTKALLIVSMLAFLTGCSNHQPPNIEEYVWSMSSVQSLNDNGEIIAYGANEKCDNENAVQVELECSAKDGVLEFKDVTNNKTYVGSYKLENANAKSINYSITIGTTKGFAVVSYTMYDNDSNMPTLIMNLGNYALNFYENNI